MKKNSPELWDKLWEKYPEQNSWNYALRKEELSIRWNRIKNIILTRYGSFDNLNVIEIGAGAGTYSTLMARKNAHVTILDYSDKAIDLAKLFTEGNNIDAKFVKANALSLPVELSGKYDIAMSFGLAEHFSSLDRVKIIKAHFDLIRHGGMAFISVPNKYNIPYRINKFVSEKTDRWLVGEEYPFSRRELKSILQLIGISEYNFIGDSLLSSFGFIKSTPFIRKFMKTKHQDSKNLKYETGTSLDAFLSYALVLCAKK
jgi:2-polyprenyl-3-methyl-5-hydroxy-6-metoxy-1,4-benzoquinol methylase